MTWPACIGVHTTKSCFRKNIFWRSFLEIPDYQERVRLAIHYIESVPTTNLAERRFSNLLCTIKKVTSCGFFDVGWDRKVK